MPPMHLLLLPAAHIVNARADRHTHRPTEKHMNRIIRKIRHRIATRRTLERIIRDQYDRICDLEAWHQE